MANTKFTEVAKGNFHAPELGIQDIIIDGLFGSGLNRPLTGGFAGIVPAALCRSDDHGRNTEKMKKGENLFYMIARSVIRAAV